MNDTYWARLTVAALLFVTAELLWATETETENITETEVRTEIEQSVSDQAEAPVEQSAELDGVVENNAEIKVTEDTESLAGDVVEVKVTEVEVAEVEDITTEATVEVVKAEETQVAEPAAIELEKVDAEIDSADSDIAATVESAGGVTSEFDVAEANEPETTEGGVEAGGNSETEGKAEPGLGGLLQPIAEIAEGVFPDEVIPQKALQLLGSEVQPGTTARLSWNPSDTFMGIAAPTSVLVVNGEKEGPTLCLAAAVHGDELNGIEMVRNIVYSVEPSKLSGAIIGVPIVNLQGFRRSSRYLPDRRDLNRYFPGRANGSAASRIAHSFFEQVVSHCDYLVDLHTGSFGRTNLPQLRADLSYEQVTELADKMGNLVVVQSQGASGSLRRAAVEAGIPAVTLEAGEPHILQKLAVEQGVKSIQTLLHALDMAKTLSFWELRKSPVYYKSRWVRSVNGGILFSKIELGAVVNPGDLLGTVTDPITNLSEDIVSPYDGKIIGMALDQVMYPGYAAYHIGLQTPVETAAEGVSEEENDIEDLENALSAQLSSGATGLEEGENGLGSGSDMSDEVDMLFMEDFED